MAVEIASTDAFQAWLEDKPRAWTQILAIRTALRALPVAWGDPKDYEAYEAAAIFRAAILCWTACKWPSHEAHVSLVVAATRLRWGAGGTSILRPAALAIAAEDDDIAAVDTVAAMISAIAVLNARKGDAVESSDLWTALSADLTYLSDVRVSQALAALRLSSRPLWHRQQPPWSVESTERMREALEGRGAELQLWVDWYARRIGGSESAFGLPPAEDETIGHRLSIASSKFWGRNFPEIATEILGWIDALRPPAPLPESQNRIAPTFESEPNGRVDLAVDPDASRALIGEEAADQHAEARFAVECAIAACRGNAAAAIREKLERYREALGDVPGAIRPGLLVQRGEALRQELQLRQRGGAADSDLPPLLDTALLDVKAVVTAHNMLVELNAPLAARDRAILGPDAVQAQISREDAQAVIESASEAGVLTPAARDVLETAAELAPPEADPQNRLSRMLTETIRNFGRKIVSMLAARMRTVLYTGAALNMVATTFAAEAAIGLANAAALGTGATLGGGYRLGKWALANEVKLRGMFEGNESMQLLIDRLMSELRRLPLD